MKKSARFALKAALMCALSPIIPVDAEDADNGSTLQEIVVTAQRREQSLQDVPISVTALTGEAIENGGFADVQDMANFVPNLFMRDHITSQSIVIRGIGTATGNEAFEQAVSQFVDGVYYGRDNLGQNAVFDVERIEVVRGPQPIFAGQSSTAGAINVINRRPGKTLEGSASAAYGSDKEYSFDGAVGGPLTDTLGARVSGRYYELGDTQYHNPALNNEPVGVKRNKAARLIATWTPSDAIDFTFKYEHQDVWQRGTGGEPVDCELRPQYSRASSSVAPGLPALCALDAVVLGANLRKLNGDAFTGGVYDARAAVDALNAASGAAPGSPNYWGYNSGPGVTGLQALAYGLNRVKEFTEPQVRDYAADVYMGNFNWRLGSLTLSSTTSFVRYDKHDVLDPDYSAFAVFSDHRAESFRQKAEEIRLTSPVDQKLSWMVGAYYQRHDMDTTINVYLPRLLGTPYAPAGSRAASFGGTLTEKSEWINGFFASTWNVSDRFRVNFGGRYEDARKDGILPATVAFLSATGTEFSPQQPIPVGFAGATPATGTVKAKGFLPEFGFAWDVKPGVMSYVKYAEAFKNGGFVMSPPIGGGLPDPFTFKPEYAKGYELGVKSRLLDNRLEVNADIYYTKYTDLQASLFVASVSKFITTNAGEAHTQGFEFDGRWLVTNGFTLGFSGSLGAEAKYDVYDGAACNSLEAKSVPPPCRTSRAGASIPFSSTWQVGLQPDYHFALANGYRIKLGANLVRNSGYVISENQDPRERQPAYNRIDARVALASRDDRWEVALYGRNITDDQLMVADYTNFMASSLDPTVRDAWGPILERGRAYGAQVTYRLGN